jgi:hypothetical protein
VRFLVTDSPTAALTETALPGRAELDVVEDHSFYCEVWARSNPDNPFDLDGGTLDLQFNPAYGKILSVESVNANWTGGSDGIVDNVAGTLTGLTRTDATPSQGDDEWVLFARVQFSGMAPVDEVNHAFGPYNAGLALTQMTLIEAGSPQPASLVAADTAKVYAVIYDVNDDAAVNGSDFSFFSAAYGGTVGSAESPNGPYYTWADFDGSGRVLSGDLSWFSPVYRKSTSAIDFYDMPNRYRPSAGPQGIRPNSNAHCYAVRIPLPGEGAPAAASAAQSPLAATSIVSAAPGPSTAVVPDVAIPSPQKNQLATLVSSAAVLMADSATRTREAAVDQLFASSTPAPIAPVANGKEAAAQAAAGKTQQAALYDAALAKSLDEILRNASLPAAKKTTTLSALAPASIGLDHNLVDVLVKDQLKN